MNAQLQLGRLPETDEELWHLVKTLWGIEIPRTRVCEGHSSPYEAFADAYYARQPWALWYGARGSGKSLLLAILGLTKAALLGVDVTLLGGSMAQSNNVREHIDQLLRHKYAPTYAIAQSITTQIKFNHGNWIRPLPASQTTVRGPHPAMTLLDEIDEMDYDLYTAAQGQAMPQRDINNHTVRETTVASSTWQRPDATFKKVIDEARQEGRKVHLWCVSAGSLITTARGNVPIEEVTNDDLVLTRNGFRHVQHVTFMGYKPTITLNVGDTELRTTSDHRIATPNGWVESGTLATDTMSTTRANPSVIRCELMSLPTTSSPRSESPSPRLVDTHSDNIKMFDVHTGPVTAQMVNSEFISNRPDSVQPYPAVSSYRGAFSWPEDDTFYPIPVTFGPRPVDAVSGEHGNILTPVYDIGVEGEHEFIANGIVVHNCLEENREPHGWMTTDFINRKKATVPAAMWRTEYLLGEPSGISRAFDAAAVESTFQNMETVRATEHGDDITQVFEEPVDEGMYAAGADWAKERDHTVIVVMRTDVHPYKCVYFRRIRRHPWPVMISSFNETVSKYHASSAHDATGLGNVVTDLVSERTTKVVMVGNERTKLLTSYINSLEMGKYELPRNSKAYDAHKSCSVAAVFYPGKSHSHLPDEVAAFALAHRATGDTDSVVAGIALPKPKTTAGGDRSWVQKLDFPAEAVDEQYVKVEGNVLIRDEETGVDVFWT